MGLLGDLQSWPRASSWVRRASRCRPSSESGHDDVRGFDTGDALIEIGARVASLDGPFGRTRAVVLEPISKHLTHLVVEPRSRPERARLVPSELASFVVEDAGRWVQLFATTDALTRLDSNERPPGLDARIASRVPRRLPALGDGSYDSAARSTGAHERVASDGVEIHRRSRVVSAHGRVIGHVGGLIVDASGRAIRILYRPGPLRRGGKRAISIADVARIESDRVVLRAGARLGAGES